VTPAAFVTTEQGKARLIPAKVPASICSRREHRSKEQMLVGIADLRKSAPSVREPLRHADQQHGLSIRLGYDHDVVSDAEYLRRAIDSGVGRRWRYRTRSSAGASLSATPRRPEREAGRGCGASTAGVDPSPRSAPHRTRGAGPDGWFHDPARATRVAPPNRNFPCITDECPGVVQKKA
jgi:hypothetical protein